MNVLVKKVKKRGFTIVELCIVIIIIGILATIVVVGISSWRKRTAETEVKNDLNAIAALMESARNFGNGYPTTVPTTFKSSPNVIVTYVSGDTKSYCIDATSTVTPVYYFVSTTGGNSDPVRGTCVSGPLPDIPSGVVAWSNLDDYCGNVSSNTYCWGRNDRGQVGQGTTGSSILTPTRVSGPLAGKVVTAVEVDGLTTCALASGAIYCWGGNQYGEMGNGTTSGVTANPTPVAVNTSGVLSGQSITQIARGTNHTCALASGAVYCWGYNGYGQLGNNSLVDSSVPVAVNTSGVLSGKTITSVKTGNYSTCVLASGSVYCFGRNASGQLGNNSFADSSVPVAVNTAGVLSGKAVTALASEGDARAACALAAGAAYCWGENGLGQLGNNSTTNSSVPVAVSVSGVLSGQTVTQISTSYTHTCAIANGAAYCWGSNNVDGSGQLGNNSLVQSTIPVAVNTSGVLAGKTLMSIRAANGHTCAIASYQPYCWGDSSGSATLGNGTTANSLVPILVNNP